MSRVGQHITLACAVLLLVSCTKPANEKIMNEQQIPEGANRLYLSTSPYLKQHAFNPVDWYPWGTEALEKARAEDKPILVSIGYSSCHWCHVMERECFENDSIAELMNEYFINIKVDREERPDVDQIYMEAVQAMGLQGGWPLNVFLTPDQKPFYGGTYFPPKNWATLLTNIHTAYTNKRSEINASADELADALAVSELLKYKLKANEVSYDAQYLETFYKSLEQKFDTARGGFNRAPKFPMPVNWKFLLAYADVTENDSAREQVFRTLNAMAAGGIFDQIGGGFARYSTDADWLVPHFEKMLYDNGQLVALYADAYKISGNERYREVVEKTVGWLEREMTSADGGFYAALDADSEGVEGKYYVWHLEELQKVLGTQADVVADYYNVRAEGNWEHVNILHRTEEPEVLASSHGLTLKEFQHVLQEAEGKLLAARQDRVRPGLDDKILAGWNGMMITGLVKAWEAFGEKRFLELALRNGRYLQEHLIRDGRLMRLKPTPHQQINGYLEDYAFVTTAFLNLYQATFDPQWLKEADMLTSYCVANFLDEKEDMFFYSDSAALIARKKEIFDNVIPASNSQMAINLYFLGKLLDEEAYLSLSDRMLGRIQPIIGKDAAYLSNWAILYSLHASPTAEIAFVGEKAGEFRNTMNRGYHPNTLYMGATEATDYPVLMSGKEAMDGRTTIYVCYNKTCKLPVHSTEEAMKQLN